MTTDYERNKDWMTRQRPTYGGVHCGWVRPKPTSEMPLLPTCKDDPDVKTNRDD
jgi:hypothetical protein